MAVEFVKREGQLAPCLGVDEELASLVDKTVQELADKNASMITIVETVRDTIPMNESQFASFMFGLGYWAKGIGF